MKIWRTFCSDTQGATMLEYGLLVALLATAISSVVFTVGDNIASVLQRVAAVG